MRIRDDRKLRFGAAALLTVMLTGVLASVGGLLPSNVWPADHASEAEGESEELDLRFEAAPGGGYVARWSLAAKRQPESALVRCWKKDKVYDCMSVRIVDMSAEGLPSGGSVTWMMETAKLPRMISEFSSYAWDKRNSSGYNCYMYINLDGVSSYSGITEYVRNKHGTIAENQSTEGGLYFSWHPWSKHQVNEKMIANKLNYEEPYFNCSYIYQKVSGVGLEALSTSDVTLPILLGTEVPL